MTSPAIRPATAADAPALAALKLATFRATFLDEFAIPYPPDDLAVFEAETYGLAKVESELADPAHRTWVVDGANGQLDAYVHLGPCKLPHPDLVDGDPEIYQLYLRREAQGRGLGKLLLDHALAHLGTERPVWIGVWSGNDRAQHVYGQRGFHPVGTYEFPVGEWRDAEVIMRLDPK
ncbi:MAG: GNAT family N-acetyltransferase [Sphingomonadales bacterium]|nr:GNAT family N-acetyltransferase [Sphingomonadales bacterium]